MSCFGCKGCNSSNSTSNKLPNIVLVGNPNVGKSVIFNSLTGFYAEVSNYPGTTVDTPVVNKNWGKLIDTPGIYGIGEENDEEIITKNVILKADIILNVVSALSLERDLFLTLQLIDRGYPIIVALNQYDEALSKGLNININVLEKQLGVKVVPTVATKNEGIEKIKYYLKNSSNILKAKEPDYLKEFLNEINQTDYNKNCVLNAIELNKTTKELIYLKRRKFINEIVQKALSTDYEKQSFSEISGNVLLNPIIGSLTALVVLWGLYQIIGVLVAGNIVNYLENNILLKYYSPFMEKIIKSIFSNSTINEILVGEFGLLTMTVQYIIGILLPLVVSFNLFMAVLEDSGYLPRLAALSDRFLTKIGLNGRAIIPIILGFGCVTMATITTRILGSNRERTIATAILGLTIPCSAQLGIIVGLLAIAGGFKAWIIYLVTIFSVLALTGTALNRLLPGESTHLFIDLPPMRLPLLKNIISKTFSKTKHFLIEATPMFFFGALLVSILRITGGLILIQKALAPITVQFLHLPAQTANVFIMGLIRRDFGAVGLASMAGMNGTVPLLSSLQIIVSLVVITLFVPCIASVVIMYKERGWREASLIWFGSWVFAFLTGAILSNTLKNIF